MAELDGDASRVWRRLLLSRAPPGASGALTLTTGAPLKDLRLLARLASALNLGESDGSGPDGPVELVVAKIGLGAARALNTGP